MERSTPTSSVSAASLNLNGIDERQRANAWSDAARTYFPGLTVELKSPPALGSMQGMQFGSGYLWRIYSPPLFVSYRPSTTRAAANESFSVMLQLKGSTTAAQNRRTCRLDTHDFCVIDGRAPFELEVSSPISEIMFLQIPRSAVTSRHPYLAHRTAERFNPNDAGAVLLRSALRRILQLAPYLESDQRGATLASVAQMLGAARLPVTSERSVNWRVRNALAYIDAHLSDTSLSAEGVARNQGISRRRLDDIFLKTLGVSLTSHIWARRLEQAAADLANPLQASTSVTQIAFSVGFKNVAHFTRAFRRRYECTPCEWRERPRDDG